MSPACSFKSRLGAVDDHMNSTKNAVRMILRWQKAMVELRETGSDSFGAGAVSQIATNNGEFEPCFRRGAGTTV